MSPESQVLCMRIAAYWDSLPRPTAIVDYCGLEEASLSRKLEGKTWREADLGGDLGAEDLFIFLNPPGKLYFLGAVMLHVLGLCDHGKDMISISYPMIGLVSALRLISKSSLEFAEEVSARPDCFVIVRDFVAYVFSLPETQEGFEEECTAVPQYWRTLESLREHMAKEQAKHRES